MYDAWAIFAGVDIENGFEVWRTLGLATTQKSQAEVLRLEGSILMPDRARSANDIEKALVDWDALYASTLRLVEAPCRTIGRSASSCASCRPTSTKTC